MVQSTLGIGTRVLITILIISNCLFVKLMAQSASSGPSDCLHAKKSSWLVQELNGAHLRFTIVAEPPWTTAQRGPNETVTYKGSIVDIADYLAQALNITYSFIPISKDDRNKYGPVRASINLLKNNEADLITWPIGLLNCAKIMDCSVPLNYQKFQLMVPFPEKETQIVAPIRPFQYQVWIGLPISMIVVSFALILLQKYYRGQLVGSNPHHESFVSNFYKAIVYLVAGEGEWNGFDQLSFRLVQGAWCLAAFVFFNAYCSTLISYLISPRIMPMAKTYEDVASGYPQKLKYMAEKNEFYTESYLMANSGPLKGIGDLLRRFPESQFTNREKGFDLMLTGQYAYSAIEVRIAIFMKMAFLQSRSCKFIVTNNTLNSMTVLVWGYPTNWRYTNAVNDRLKWLVEWGLVDYWIKKTIPQNDECKALSKARDDRKILSLNDLSGPFIFLIMGSILSVCVFLLEKLYYHFNRLIDLKSHPPIEAIEIDHSLSDKDPCVVLMDEPLVDGENRESYLDATKDKVVD